MHEETLCPANAKLQFFRMIPTAPDPVPADGSAAGTLPVRAYKFCEPIRIASSIGWYVFPPIDFSVIWDGTTINWKCAGLDDWMPLTAAQFPRFSKSFDSSCPEDIKGYSPPFISSVLNPGIFQLWSGLIAKTAPDWYLNVRPPINLPQTRHAHSFEGIVETDSWFGPLFTNFQISKSDVEVKFSRSEPIFLVSLVHASMTAKASSVRITVSEMADMQNQDWELYKRTIVDRVGENRVAGSYAVKSRKNRASTFEK